MRCARQRTRLVSQAGCAEGTAVGVVHPERKAPFEDLDPGCWRGSCQLEVVDFKDTKLCTCNLLHCPRFVQRRCVVVLALGEESCDCRTQIKWASVPRNLSPPGISFDNNIDCGSQGENVEDVNVVVPPFRPHMGDVQEMKREICTVGGRRAAATRSLTHFCLLNLCRHSVVFEESDKFKLQVTRKHQNRADKVLQTQFVRKRNCNSERTLCQQFSPHFFEPSFCVPPLARLSALALLFHDMVSLWLAPYHTCRAPPPRKNYRASCFHSISLSPFQL